MSESSWYAQIAYRAISRRGWCRDLLDRVAQRWRGRSRSVEQGRLQSLGRLLSVMSARCRCATSALLSEVGRVMRQFLRFTRPFGNCTEFQFSFSSGTGNWNFELTPRLQGCRLSLEIQLIQ